MTGDAQMLLASVLSTKGDAQTTFAILNAGINLAESCRSEYHRSCRSSARTIPLRRCTRWSGRSARLATRCTRPRTCRR